MRIERNHRLHRPFRERSSPYVENWGGRFFSEFITLPAGRYAARIHICQSEKASGEIVTLIVRDAQSGQEIGRDEFSATKDNPRRSDESMISFDVVEYGVLEISGEVSANCETTLLRRLTIVDATSSKICRKDFFEPAVKPFDLTKVERLHIGTTGVCNASCIHCPTNKPGMRMPSGRMDIKMFERLIDDLRAGGFKGEICFALFAEPLDDPHLIERLRYIRQTLDCRISLSTNCALFDPAKHAEMITLLDHISVHVESADPVVYNKMMRPLKAAKVFPKIQALLDLADEKQRDHISLTAPLHKENINSFFSLSDLFDRGRNSDYLNPGTLSSGCRPEGLFRDIALAPTAESCRPNDLQANVFIDWNGDVVPCCRDFSKSMVFGNLANQTLAAVFGGERRSSLAESFRRGEWASKKACENCRVDQSPAVRMLIEGLKGYASPQHISFPPAAFRLGMDVVREGDHSIVARSGGSDGCVIYGPYSELPRGEFHASFELSLKSAPEADAPFTQDAAYIVVEATDGDGTKVMESKVLRLGELDHGTDITFRQETAGHVQFRIFKHGPIDIVFGGVLVTQTDLI
ncbi:radical SAM/SPASM domain-containing protein [Sphingomonas sp. PWP1-2]|uniref:radical SAM/SPASM domain-containing protein n=1 Tax=Sphingomonas sp. PWP1-2 TaxID=2804558 RepID=UPI003CE719C7